MSCGWQCSASCVQNDAYIDIAMLVVFCVYWLVFQFNCYATKLTCALDPVEPNRKLLRCEPRVPIVCATVRHRVDRSSSAALHSLADRPAIGQIACSAPAIRLSGRCL